MNDITGGILQLEETDIEDRDLEAATEIEVRCLMDDHAGKGEQRDDESRNKEHGYLFILLGELCRAKTLVVLVRINDLARLQPVVDAFRIFFVELCGFRRRLCQHP